MIKGFHPCSNLSQCFVMVVMFRTDQNIHLLHICARKFIYMYVLYVRVCVCVHSMQ